MQFYSSPLRWTFRAQAPGLGAPTFRLDLASIPCPALRMREGQRGPAAGDNMEPEVRE